MALPEVSISKVNDNAKFVGTNTGAFVVAFFR